MDDHPSWEHCDVETNGIRLHCVTQGDGDLVVLLHGFPEFWYSWRYQIPHLAGRFKVVAPDLRGYGDSDKPAGVEPYGAMNLISDVKGLIEAAGTGKAHVIGHDWGGVVAWVFAIVFPELVDKLVVLNAPHPGIFAKNLRNNPGQLRKSWYVFFFQLPGIPEASLRAGNYYMIKRVLRGWTINKDAFSDDDLARFVDAAGKRGALTGGINYYRAMLHRTNPFKMPTDYPRITSPTMLIWAENDGALGKELTYGLDRYCAGETVIRYIPRCSHWVQQEQPLLVNRYLDEFL
jgi:pimeloyl-ACP methyl ester carboxylesterase